MSEGVDMLAADFGSGLPVVKGKPESNLLLERNVADQDGTVESGRPGLRKRQSLDVDIGMGVGGIGKWSGLIRIDDWERTLGGKRGWNRRVWEGESCRLCLCLGFGLFTSRSRDVGRLAGPVVDADRFKTVIRLCKVDVFENVRSGGSRLST